MAEWNPKTIDVSTITREQARAELARELTLRVNAYPKFIDQNKLTPERATAQQAAMKKAWLLLGEEAAVDPDTQAKLLRSTELLHACDKLGPNPQAIIERILARGGIKRLAVAYKVLDLVEAGTDISVILQAAKEFPGSQITAVNDPPISEAT